MNKEMAAVLDFAIKYTGWHGFNSCCVNVLESVRALESLGLLEADYSTTPNKFRAIEKSA